MNEALELLRIGGLDAQQFGALLAVLSRGMGQGGTVSSIVSNLERSAADGSQLARNVLASFEQADSVLKCMASGQKPAKAG